jgi:hypothetical protein
LFFFVFFKLFLKNGFESKEAELFM